jgi:hypothetical protein
MLHRLRAPATVSPQTKSDGALSSPLFLVRAATTRVSFLFLPLGSPLTYPFISVTYRDNVGSPPAITSHPPTSECHRVGLSPPPHQCLTSSVSRAAILLARRTPLTVLVPVPPTAPQRGHQQTLAAHDTTPTLATMTAPHCARARAARFAPLGHRNDRAKPPDGPPCCGVQRP